MTKRQLVQGPVKDSNLQGGTLPLMRCSRSTIREAGFWYWEYGCHASNQIKDATFALSAILYTGDLARNIPVIQDPEEILRYIVKLFCDKASLYGDNLGILFDTGALQRVSDAVAAQINYRHFNPKPQTRAYDPSLRRLIAQQHASAKDLEYCKQQRGNRKKSQEAQQKVFQVVTDLFKKLGGNLPSISMLSKKAKCGESTARQVLKNCRFEMLAGSKVGNSQAEGSVNIKFQGKYKLLSFTYKLNEVIELFKKSSTKVIKEKNIYLPRNKMLAEAKPSNIPAKGPVGIELITKEFPDHFHNEPKPHGVNLKLLPAATLRLLELHGEQFGKPGMSLVDKIRSTPEMLVKAAIGATKQLREAGIPLDDVKVFAENKNYQMTMAQNYLQALGVSFTPPALN